MNRWTRTISAGGLYFTSVFAVGFVLGCVRILWLVPRLGTTMAELAELPIMLLVTVGAARYVARQLQVPFRFSDRLAMGAAGTTLLLAAEFTLVPLVRGISLQQYSRTRDPVSSTAYYGAVLAFAIMPLLVSRTHAPVQQTETDFHQASS